MIWYVHRHTPQGPIASAHAELQPGYAEEALDDVLDQEMREYQAIATQDNREPR